MSRELLVPVRGMSCAGCAAGIEKGLAKVDGVDGVSVSYATRSARVTGAIDEPALLAAIASLGYEGVPSLAGQLAPDDADEVRAATTNAITAGVGALVILAFGHHADFAIGFTLVALFVPGRSILLRAWRQLRHGQAGMDLLVSLGVLAALGQGVARWIAGEPVMLMAPMFILAFVLLGRALEARARRQAGGALAQLVNAVPRQARVLRDGEERDVAADEVSEGELLLVRPGVAVPVDAVVLEGSSGFDESLLSGEAMPAFKRVGDTLLAGSVNTGSQTLRARATAVGGESTLAWLVSQLTAAQSGKAPAQRLADRVAGVFVPVVVVLALLAWVFVSGGAAVAVLVIACPCALGLATPTAIQVATGRAAQLGILVRDPAAFEAAGRLDVLLVDKTGTLTRGEPVVEEFVALAGDPDEALAAAVGLERQSQHPLGAALRQEAARRGLSAASVAEGDVRVEAGGLRARLDDGREVIVGSPEFLADHGVSLTTAEESMTSLRKRGWSLVLTAIGGESRLIAAIGDQIRPTSTRAVRVLERAGVRPVLCTGDHLAAAQAMATLAGIATVHAGQSPQDKVERVTELQADGLRVGLVGDGSNDAPGLAAADCGLAVGSATDLARAAAPIVLVEGDLAKAATALELARATRRLIAQNLFLAFGYNIVALPLALTGRVEPPFAAAAMAASSLLVVGNALRLRRYRPSLETAFGLES